METVVKATKAELNNQFDYEMTFEQFESLSPNHDALISYLSKASFNEKKIFFVHIFKHYLYNVIVKLSRNNSSSKQLLKQLKLLKESLFPSLLETAVLQFSTIKNKLLEVGVSSDDYILNTLERMFLKFFINTHRP